MKSTSMAIFPYENQIHAVITWLIVIVNALAKHNQLAETRRMHANGPFHYLAVDLPIYRSRTTRLVEMDAHIAFFSDEVYK